MFGSEEEVLDNEVVKRLDAVREDRAIYLDPELLLAGASRSRRGTRARRRA